jgi:hypothetical protein
MEDAEFLIYVLVAGAIAIGMDLLNTPWWCYIPPACLLVFALAMRFASTKPHGKHRK